MRPNARIAACRGVGAPSDWLLAEQGLHDFFVFLERPLLLCGFSWNILSFRPIFPARGFRLPPTG